MKLGRFHKQQQEEQLFTITYSCNGVEWTIAAWALDATKAWDKVRTELDSICDGYHQWVSIEGGLGKHYKGL